MQLPTPPTDSLYKFLCISSLLAGVSLFIWSDKQIADMNRQVGDLEVEVAVSQAEVGALREAVQRSSERTRQALQKKDLDLSDGKAVLEEGRALEERLRAQTVKAAELEAKRIQLLRLGKELIREGQLRMWQAISFSLIFLVNIVYWQRHIQNPQDRLLRAQAEAAEDALKRDQPKTTGEPKRRGGSKPPQGSS